MVLNNSLFFFLLTLSNMEINNISDNVVANYYFFMLFAKFVIEGTTGDGSEGDISIDDMSVLDVNCKKIIAQGLD